jgi:hypothetical protein
MIRALGCRWLLANLKWVAEAEAKEEEAKKSALGKERCLVGERGYAGGGAR